MPPLVKTPVNINFALGIDTKTDEKQVPIGKFLSLTNSVFNITGQLTKRNGFKRCTTLPKPQTVLTTLNDNLIATGINLYAYSEDTDQWLDQGAVQPVTVRTQSMVRNSYSQTVNDAVVTPDGMACLTFMENGLCYYQVQDSNTGQQIVPRTLIPNGVNSPRVCILGRYFLITFIADIGGSFQLHFAAVSTFMPSITPIYGTIITTLATINSGYDIVVANNSMYTGWEDDNGDVRIAYVTSTLQVSTPGTVDTSPADRISMAVDLIGSTPTIYITYWNTASNNGYTASYSPILTPILAPTLSIASEELVNLVSQAYDGLLTIIYEVDNDYGSPYPGPATQTDFLGKATVTAGGSVQLFSPILRSVGLGSKMFYIVDSGEIKQYLLASYGEVNQPTYFLIDTNGNIFARLAPSNGGGYITNQVLPSFSLVDGQYVVSYLIKTSLTSVNKGTDLATGTPVNGIYSATGINLAKFAINTEGQYSSEIAGSLLLTGGQIWQYDGVKPVELGFQVWPENVRVATSATGGLITAQKYFYQFTYEWTDNQGMIHRSAPSIPVSITTTGSTSSNTLYVPTLRLTYKTTPNSVRIVGYRWSTAQQTYFQFTSIVNPTINDPTQDFVTIIDTLADSAILGNPIIYTAGGVIENIAPPASIHSSLFKNRYFSISAENRNVLNYSQIILQSTPVEMNDLFAIYVAPSSGAQGSTGEMTCTFPMDDKLIIFKKDAIYYITGNGPDATGNNNDFSEPIFVTASVGCDNPKSLVLMPNGLMFQSDKGIWLLGRDLGTNYIGDDVEAYNDIPVKSATAIPGTNQIRFVLDNSTTLMYDYFYDQWGTFTNIRAITSTLWQNLHTYLNVDGQVFQEAPNTFLDGSSPVLMSFTTSWISLAGLQGYERFYFGYLLGTYYTPFKLNMSIAYDYASASDYSTPSQSIVITPDNYNPPWGGEALWGSGEVWGGPSNTFEARFFPEQQKCETFQISMQEIYDSSYGATSGAGLALSGLSLIVGAKKGYRTQKASRSFG